MLGPNNAVTKDITGQNQFTDAVRIAGQKFSISVVAEALDGTVTLQRQIPGEVDVWRDVEAFTEPQELIAESVGSWDWRIGVKSGDFATATGLSVALVW